MTIHESWLMEPEHPGTVNLKDTGILLFATNSLAVPFLLLCLGVAQCLVTELLCIKLLLAVSDPVILF